MYFVENLHSCASSSIRVNTALAVNFTSSRKMLSITKFVNGEFVFERCRQ